MAKIMPTSHSTAADLASSYPGLAIEKMLRSLGIWVIVGLAVSVAGAIALALRISRPILKIDRVAKEVAQGNFQARVEGVRTRDEIGDLARRMNDMVVG